MNIVCSADGCNTEITANTRSKLCLRCRRRINQRRWRKKNPLKDRANTKRYRKANPKKAREIREKWTENNRDKHLKIKRDYQRKRCQTDIQFYLRQRLRTRLNQACKLQGVSKVGSHVEDLGCSIEELKQYLESLFEPGMSWGNHGEWHIDHIIPLYSFDLTIEAEYKKACHYTNLCPMWERDHIRKTIQENIDAKSKI